MKILVAEDDSVTRELLRALLVGWGYDVVTTNDGRIALDIIATADGPTLALLDWMMPTMDGAAVCRAVRALDGPYRYLILITSKNLKSEVVEGLDAGADDYLTKPVILPELQARLRAARRILDLQTELLVTQERLRVEATHDALTGLWNRRALVDSLERETARARRDQRPVSVLLGDLDRFKNINDTFGHGGGDAVLKDVSRKLLTSVRPYDMVARYGGEELAVMLPDSDAASAAIVAERIRQRVRCEPVQLDGCQIPVTISVGMATCAEGCCSVDALIKRADEALYAAKRKGRDRVERGADPGCPTLAPPSGRSAVGDPRQQSQ